MDDILKWKKKTKIRTKWNMKHKWKRNKRYQQMNLSFDFVYNLICKFSLQSIRSVVDVLHAMLIFRHFFSSFPSNGVCFVGAVFYGVNEDHSRVIHCVQYVLCAMCVRCTNFFAIQQGLVMLFSSFDVLFNAILYVYHPEASSILWNAFE